MKVVLIYLKLEVFMDFLNMAWINKPIYLFFILKKNTRVLMSVNVCVLRWPVSVITPAILEAVGDCLFAQAEMAERDTRSPAQAEHMVLEEFGHCLSQIAKAMFEKKTN